MGSNVNLDSGVVICPNVTLTADIQVGTFSLINCHSSAGHDVDIGAWSTISGHCDLTGGCKIGEGAFLGTGCACCLVKQLVQMLLWARRQSL